MQLSAFGPRGLTANIAANQTASAPVKVVSSPSNFSTYQFVNVGGNTVYFAWDTTGGQAAAIPVAGTPAQGVPILSNEIVIYSLAPQAYISVICETGKTSNLLVTVGEGM